MKNFIEWSATNAIIDMADDRSLPELILVGIKEDAVIDAFVRLCGEQAVRDFAATSQWTDWVNNTAYRIRSNMGHARDHIDANEYWHDLKSHRDYVRRIEAI